MKTPSTTPHELAKSLEVIAESSDLIGLLRQSADLRKLVNRTIDPGRMLRALTELADVDTFATLAVIESLAGLPHTGADDLLTRYLEHPEAIVRRHAAWRLGDRPPTQAAYGLLANRVTVGGMDTMHAHRTLRSWSRFDPSGVVHTIDVRLLGSSDPAARARLIDVLGVIDDPAADTLLTVAAFDPLEAPTVRSAAIGALGHRRVGPAVESGLRTLARRDDDLGAHAAIAIADLSQAGFRTAGRPGFERRTRRIGGLRIAQLTLTGELDRDLSRGGKGDTGGVASLLVSLGRALAERDDVARVLTIGRGSLTDVVADQLVPDVASLAYGTLAFGDDARPADSPGQAWEHLPTIERAIVRVLRNRPVPDVLHLRMSDVGSLAGAGAAAIVGVDTCFSLAPDPHGVIRSLQDQGRLDRRSFIDLTTTDHAWFRARLVERLAVESPAIALFPRSTPHRLFDVAVDLDPGGRRGPAGGSSGRRVAVIPEGIDLALTKRAEQLLAERESNLRSLDGGGDRTVLDDLVDSIPAERRHLPLLVSVGRLNPIKGMDRVAEAWAGDLELHRSCTLVIVGGALADPSPVERSVLNSIADAVPADSEAAPGLVLLGGRPRQDIALLLAATAAGNPGHWAPGGTYVDGAYKEEFGLALIEALAAGLVVTAPNVGGPPTYVEHGRTGILIDPDADLAPAIVDAFALVTRPGRAARARRLVEDRYSVETMAARLVDLYAAVPALL